uniref:Uncharacterized protein n=2 Tax=Sphaerodactylus townsendi TaxID=933632 RepID=A0ACB8EDW4_9SAUR
MVLCMLWCSVIQSLLLPLFLWACDRYRADLKSVWEKCVAIMSNDDAEEENSLEGAIHTELMYERAYDYNFSRDSLTLDHLTKYDLSALERGLPSYPVKTPPEDKMQYLQVPPTRRFSHDETDIWTTGQISAYLQRWGAGEDVASGLAHLLIPRHGHDWRRSSLVSYPEEGRQHRKRRKSAESVLALRPFSCEDFYKEGGGYKCFGKEEVVSFIDDPMPSPRNAPMRSASVSLIPDALQHCSDAAALARFPLTDFEREPQVLRRFSGRGGSLTVPRQFMVHEDAKNLFPKGSDDPSCFEQIRIELCEAQTPEDRGVSSSRSEPEGFRTGLSPYWGLQGDLRGNSSKGGSTSSFLSSPSASSGYVTFHSGSIGSAS